MDYTDKHGWDHFFEDYDNILLSGMDNIDVSQIYRTKGKLFMNNVDDDISDGKGAFGVVRAIQMFREVEEVEAGTRPQVVSYG